MPASFMHDDRPKHSTTDERRRLLDQAKKIIKERSLVVPENFSELEEKFLRGDISINEIDEEIARNN